MSETLNAMPEPESAPRSTGALERARADLANGRPDLARERLTGLLYTYHRRGEYREEVYLLLGEVHYAMKDFSRAGAAWLLTTKAGPGVDEAMRAFHARHGQDPVNVLNAVKPRVPSELYPPQVGERLKDWGYRYRPYRPRSNPHVLEELQEQTKGLRPFEVGCALLVLAGTLAAALYLLRAFRII